MTLFTKQTKMCLLYQTSLFTTHWLNHPHTFNGGLTCHRSPRSLRSSRSKSTWTLWSTSPCLCGAYIQTSPLLSCVWKGMMVRFRSVSVQSFEAARTEDADCCSCARDRQRVCLCALRWRAVDWSAESVRSSVSLSLSTPSEGALRPMRSTGALIPHTL